MDYHKICQDLISAQHDGHMRRHRQLTTYREIINIVEKFLHTLTSQSNSHVKTACEVIKTENNKAELGALLVTIKITVSINETPSEFTALISIPADDAPSYITIENEDVVHYTKDDVGEQLINVIINRMKLGLKYA